MTRPPRPRDTDSPLAWAEYYLSLGWGLSHFAPGTKGPQGRGWNTPAEWIDTSAKAAAQWAKTPTHGMGVIHAASGTVAIDVDHVDYTRLVFREFGIDIDACLTHAPQIQGKRSGRAKAIFAAPDGDALPMYKAAWTRPPEDGPGVTLFELRAGAVHDVLPPSQHPDGHRYVWLFAPWEVDALPPLPDELLHFWREFPSLKDHIAALAPWAAPVVPPSRPRLRVEGHNDVIGAYNRAHSIHALLLAHGYKRKGNRYLAPASTSRIPGVTVLDGVKAYSHHGSDPLADGHAHDAFDVFRVLEHGGDEKAAVTAASAMLDIPVYGARVPGVDFSELLAAATKRSRATAPAEPPRFPAALLNVPGLVGDLAGYINRTARYPQPVLALGAAIAAAGTLMGRKVRTESDLRTNVYVLGVAEAGAGKEHARQTIRTVFDHAGAFRRVAVEGLASDAAVNTALVSVPSSLFLLDEVGRLLAVLSDARAGSHLSEIITQLLKLYSAAAGPYCGKVYADADRNQVVQQPNLSIYGTTVPSVFYGALTTAQIEDGFLSRLLVFESEDPDPEPQDVFAEEPPHALVEQCAVWERTPEHSAPERGNVDVLTRPFPRTVSPDPAARLRLTRFEAEMRDRRRQLRAAGRPAGFYVRTAAAAQKLALIRAAGVAPDSPLITADDAEWGCALALHLADRMAWRILSHVAENAIERAVKRVASLVRDAGAVGMTRSELTKKTQWLRSSERVDVLATLVQSGQVFARAEKGSTRPIERFLWFEHADEPDTSNPSIVAA